jgi:hypothetical protein
MKLLFIQEFQVAFRNLENLSAQPPDDALRRQQVIALDAILLGRELDSDHGLPLPYGRQNPRVSQSQDGHKLSARGLQRRSGGWLSWSPELFTKQTYNHARDWLFTAYQETLGRPPDDAGYQTPSL